MSTVDEDAKQTKVEQSAGEELWRHRDPSSTPMYKFMQKVNQKYNRSFTTYDELYRWSVTDISSFWAEVWDFVGIVATEPYRAVVDESAPMYPRPEWFAGAKLNFAQNLLYPPVEIDPTSSAIIAATETQREVVSWEDLRARVKECQGALKALGIGVGDRVVGYAGNHVSAVVWMLGATSLGAIWSAVSPDSGVSMVVDRMAQINPKVLFTDDGQFYNGKRFGVLEKVAEIVKNLESLEAVVVFEVVGESTEVLKKASGNRKMLTYPEFVNLAERKEGEVEFVQLPPDHPVYILYSSGTTGAPKCIVHGAIGTLIQHKKEHILHSSILPGQRLFYYTTTTWMMWHWLISGLASGATLILYDGSPMRYRSTSSSSSSCSSPSSIPDDLAVPRLISELSINHFGTSAKYLSLLEQKNLLPSAQGISMPSLQAIYNTASPLAPSTFRYVYRAFGSDINLGSITGGTDIISLFGAACPLLPVYAGYVQCRGLGMAVRSWDSDTGNDLSDSQGTAGDLVCVKSFPCQPVAFWGQDGEKKYRASYFERFPDVWHHGDYIELNPETCGMLMLGRSDGVLNPAGIRFGSAEIYNVLLKHFPGRVADGLCVGRRKEGEADETVVLFLKMEEGCKFDEELAKEIKKEVRSALSARHVPAVVDECPDIPVTVNGKKIEGAVKQIISGSKVKTSASVANVECLDFYREWAATH